MTYLDRARAAWGEPLPDWIDTLATACELSSQSSAAARIGYSKTAISLLINGKYDRDLSAIERAVRQHLMRPAPIDCPVLGEIDAERCAETNQLPYSPANPRRVRLFRTCPNCRYRGVS